MKSCRMTDFFFIAGYTSGGATIWCHLGGNGNGTMGGFERKMSELSVQHHSSLETESDSRFWLKQVRIDIINL